MRYILALDQGTTSSRAIIFRRDGVAVASAGREFRQHYPRPGWVEHDANEIWESQLAVAREAMAAAGVGAHDIAAVGIANQRETAVVWDRRTGEPVCPAIVWQCRRTADYCARLKSNGFEPMIKERTGLVADPYFSATKLRWVLDNVPGTAERAARGELAFGTVDSWLIYKLTLGRVHATDMTNAARTMLYNIHTLSWDERLLSLFGIPDTMLPEVRLSSADFGACGAAWFGGEIPIRGVAGDQHAALFGQACFNPGDVKNTYGTGGFLLMNIGERPAESRSGLLTTLAWGLPGGVTYALEGSVFVAGAAVQWLRDELGIIKSAAESETLAQSVPDNAGVYMVPAFTGLGAPYWDSAARGAIIGLTRGAGRAHIARCALEAVAYQTEDVLAAMRRDTGLVPAAIRADGGASANNFLMQFQADISRSRVLCPASHETTAAGAAFLAGLGAGYYGGTDEVSRLVSPGREFNPIMDGAARERLLAGWRAAVEVVLVK